jgi:hypothetical protein
VLLASQASAQIIVPGLPQLPKAGGAKELQDLQKQLQKALEMQRRELEGLQQQPAAGDNAIRWGGIKLNKADANLRQQLGLDEKEGLVIASVDPNSAGDKAGLKANDVLIRINDKSVPNDLDGFTKLVKDQKVDQAATLVVVRMGKEETIKGAKMPELVQGAPVPGPRRGVAGRPGIAGAFIIPLRGINPKGKPNPPAPGKINKMHLERTIDGAKVVNKIDGDQFSGEYSKDDLKITVSGKIENGQAKPGEITVTQGKEAKKYANAAEVPAQYQDAYRQCLPPASPFNGFLFPDFPGLPPIPRFDDF